MNEQTLHEAVDNISTIKSIIDRTNKSFTTFSKIFIYWGVLFILNSALNLIMTSNRAKMQDIMSVSPALNYLFPVGATALIAVLIFWRITRCMPLVGLEKHLMKVWVLTLFMNIIPNRISINTMEESVNVTTLQIYTNRFSMVLFSLAIALIATAVFADYKHLMILGYLYIGISVLNAYVSFPIFEGSTLLQFLHALPLPFTFLYTGFFLKSRQAGGTSIGH